MIIWPEVRGYLTSLKASWPLNKNNALHHRLGVATVWAAEQNDGRARWKWVLTFVDR